MDIGVGAPRIPGDGAIARVADARALEIGFDTQHEARVQAEGALPVIADLAASKAAIIFHAAMSIPCVESIAAVYAGIETGPGRNRHEGGVFIAARPDGARISIGCN